MVLYSKQVDNDLDEILEGLLSWRKNILTREFCLSYISNLIDVCDSIDTLTTHFDAVFKTHQFYGKKVHKELSNINMFIIY